MGQESKELESPERRQEDERIETLGGTVCALGLPSRRHRDLANRIHLQLSRQLEGRGCEASQGEGVHVGPMDETQHALPDVAVFCGEKKGHPDDPDILVNPTVLVEVLSPGTYQRDHVDKRIAYTAIESLRAYVIVDQAQRVVTLWARGPEEWEPSINVRGRIALLENDLVLDIDRIYDEPAE